MLLVSGLIAPQSIAAKDVVTAPINRASAQWSALPLPAIPHLEMIPWLGASGNLAPRQKVDLARAKI